MDTELPISSGAAGRPSVDSLARMCWNVESTAAISIFRSSPTTLERQIFLMPSSTPIELIRHVGIVVSDMNRSLPFYRDLLGMDVSVDIEDGSPYVQAVTGVPGARLHAVMLKAKNGVSIELLQYLTHPQPVPPMAEAFRIGCQHVALQVDNIDALYTKLKGQGIRFHTEPLVSTSGTAKVTYCRDYEGVIVELVEILKVPVPSAPTEPGGVTKHH